MRLLLDTHIFIGMVEDDVGSFPTAIQQRLNTPEHDLYLSVASLWEISIKVRLGKLPLRSPLDDLPAVAARASISLIVINERHALLQALPEPPTRDPFDRLLLAQCAIEGMQLVTIDRALADHPLSATAQSSP